MFRKFLDGLSFGSGFSITFVAILAVAFWLWHPLHFVSGTVARNVDSHAPLVGPAPARATDKQFVGQEPYKPQSMSDVESLIKQSSLIAVAKYEKQSDGKLKAVLEEFLKKDPNVEFYYKLGGEYPPASPNSRPEKNVSYGDGVIIFFVGSPAEMKRADTYLAGRILDFGGMPIELFRKKCKE